MERPFACEISSKQPQQAATVVDGKQIQEVTARLATAKEISTDAAVATVLPELDGIFTLKEDQKAFVLVFALCPTTTNRKPRRFPTCSTSSEKI